MNSPTPLRRQGAHRTRHSLAGALLPSLLAVLAVTALITSLAVWRGQDPTQPSAAASIGSPSVSSQQTKTRAASAAPGRSSSTEKPTASSTPSAGETRSAAHADVEVVVLNQSTRAGLAGTVAGDLRRTGWTVPAVGNFRGVVPATTVYYPPGDEAPAQAVAEDLATAPRIRPRFGNLSTTRLTVVVTADYPG